ncbi:hypothetical protein CC86DRAFT_273351, partial [Ophiobolus disseminans]
SFQVPPPSRHISSTPITLSSASHMLETYLKNSESHAHLHPDSTITPEGINFSSKGGPEGNVVMHNLRRIAAGLRGEYMAPEKTPELEEDEAAEANAYKGKKRKNFSAPLNDGDWQDKAEYEWQEGVLEVGDIGERSNVVQDGREEPEVQVTGGAQESAKKRKQQGAAREGLSDKEARKQAKKERHEQRKRE